MKQKEISLKEIIIIMISMSFAGAVADDGRERRLAMPVTFPKTKVERREPTSQLTCYGIGVFAYSRTLV